MRPLLASLFDSLDGVTYFFVSSAIFVLVPAVLFFSLGLWIGALTWGRFKRRFRAGQETIEDMKNELALLKRRTAELASRALPHQPGQARAVSRSPLTSPVQSASMPPPPGAAFTLWTEPGWTLQETPAAPLPPSAVFDRWLQPERATENVHATKSTTTAASGTGEARHYTVDHTPKPDPRQVPKSQAFTVWTEHAWNPHPPEMPAPPPGAPFTIWTEACFEPALNLAPRPTHKNPPVSGHSSIVAAMASTAKSIVGFPKAGAGTPTFGDWLHSQATGPENGESLVSKGSISPAEAFRAEISAGIARNDYLLGIVFTTPPAQRDDLSKLDGISASECDALEAYGVHSFKQIGFWDHDHADEFARRLGLKDRARAAKWIGQAVKLHQESGGAAS